MSYAKGTTHYNLPLTEGSDKRDWFDTNEPFNQIDAALHTAVEDTDTLKSEVATLQSDMTEAQTDIKDIKAYDALNDVKVSALQTLTAQHTVDIEDVRQDSEDMICAIEEGSATASYAHAVGEYFRYNDTLYITTVAISVGDTIVPDVNCSTTDIVSRLGNADEVSRLKTQVGDKDISSYGASVTDAIANSNVKVLDGELYKLVDGAWSPYKKPELLDISPGASDYFTAIEYRLQKIGDFYRIFLKFKTSKAITANTEFRWENWEGIDDIQTVSLFPIYEYDLARESFSYMNIYSGGVIHFYFVEDHNAGAEFSCEGLCFKK